MRQSERNEQRDGGAERGSTGRPEQIGFGQGIAKNTLENGASESEQYTDESRGEYAREFAIPAAIGCAAVIAGDGAR